MADTDEIYVAYSSIYVIKFPSEWTTEGRTEAVHGKLAKERQRVWEEAGSRECDWKGASDCCHDGQVAGC